MFTTTEPLDARLDLVITADQFTATVTATNDGRRVNITGPVEYIARLMTETSRGQRPEISVIEVDTR